MTRRLWFLAGAALVPTALFAACGFPEVTLAPADASLDGAQPDGATSDATNGSDALADVGPSGDGGAVDLDARDESEQRVDAASCTGTCGDCDEDTFSLEDAGCTSRATDCDDLDPLIHPGADYQTLPWQSSHAPAGDWNCDGDAEPQYPENLNCNVVPCGGEGFIAHVACGDTATYYACASSFPLGCQPAMVDTRRQGCR